MLYPQNGDRIVAIDTVTSFHPVYMSRARNAVRPSVVLCTGWLKIKYPAGEYAISPQPMV